MNIKVVKLYDISRIEVPARLTKWKVGEEEVQSHLEQLARSAAEETIVDCAENGDSVFLSCGKGALKGREVLLYPGRKLPGAMEAEKAVLGLPVGSSFTTELHGTTELQVEKIVRRIPASIDDHLIETQGIEGVTTVAQYRAWYKESAGEKNRQQALREIKNYLLDALAQNSEFAFDEAEMEAWVEEQLERQMELERAETGEEVQIPEEELPEMKAYYREMALREEIEKTLCRKNGFVFTPEMFEKEVKELLGDLPGMEEMEAEYKKMLLQNAYTDKAMELLEEAAEKCLEVE